jgi:cytochrome b561
MHYKQNDMYKAFQLKLHSLAITLSGQGHSHTLSKIQMFSEDAFSEQQATIDRLEKEKHELIELIMVSNVAVHYHTLQVAKQIARDATLYRSGYYKHNESV